MSEPRKVTLHVCGPSTDKCRCQCPNGPCEHEWDGPDYESADGTIVSATCSRCGMTAYEHSMWVAP